VKDKETRVTCPNQKCQACERCVHQFANSSNATDEWEMDLMLIDLGHDTFSRLDERIRLDTAIEAATLAG
jgi:hypothetical protein